METKTTSNDDDGFINPERERASAFVTTTLKGRGKIRLRRLDPVSLILENIVPMPMFTAMLGLIKDLSPEADGTDIVERLAKMDDETRRAMLDVFRRFACRAAVKPRLVMQEEPGRTDALHVEILSLTELIQIWSAVAEEPVMSPGAAQEFREEPPAHAPTAPRIREGVRPASEQLPELEFKHA